VKTYRALFISIFFFVLFLLSPFIVSAADFRSSYAIEYYIRDFDQKNVTKTSYTIKLTNLQPDLIIKKYTISFPRSFGIENITAKDDRGTIIPLIEEKDRTIETSFEFIAPKAGINEVNTLYLDFYQKNIFRSKGTIWEVFIPTVENKQNDTYSITVYLPPESKKKLSLSKPMPDLITFDRIVWNKVEGKSIYAVFGDTQQYSLDLTYHLTNPNFYRVYTDVAFPPDTLYQQIIVASILPKPDLVFSDSDGNYMGRYNLNGNENKDVVFKGVALINTIPRSDYREYVSQQFDEQKKTLFDVQSYWKLYSQSPVESSSIYDHYKYVEDTLTYNFNRIIKGNSRMGAIEAVKYPDQAVCTEYSDLLIASARQQGLYVREIQGFAFASEQELRPVQQETSDILHSWVEYYDIAKKIWIPIDPTWEDTSGIDYFNSFDFNHIVFAIHGKKADYPYPAGSYKSTNDGKDIAIEPTNGQYSIQKLMTSSISSIPLPQQDNQFGVDFTVTNMGNVSVWNVPISISVKNARIQKNTYFISHLLPGETKKETIIFKPNGSFISQDVEFSVTSDKTILHTKTIRVPTIVTTIKNNLLPLFLIVGGIITFIAILRKKNDNI